MLKHTLFFSNFIKLYIIILILPIIKTNQLNNNILQKIPTKSKNIKKHHVKPPL